MNKRIADCTLADVLPPGASFKVLGVRVHAVQIPDVVGQMRDWISQRDGCHFIAVTGMHGVAEAQHEPYFKKILNEADLVVPDGMPLVWLGQHHGHPLQRRVYGPELMQTFCSATRSQYRHFLYGGMPGVPELLSGTLQQQFGINVVGQYSPPFRALTLQEDEEIVNRINAVNPDVLWVGLSTPKQERWMYEHRQKLRIPVMVGVGAAFDLNSGRVKQAPRCAKAAWSGPFACTRNHEGCGGATWSTAQNSLGRLPWSCCHCVNLSRARIRSQSDRDSARAFAPQRSGSACHFALPEQRLNHDSM
jgi:N-acetylglucosaminyldiphosphoundecaprenol N-acetyl-beta-D-mannosaminyltransferase